MRLYDFKMLQGPINTLNWVEVSAMYIENIGQELRQEKREREGKYTVRAQG